MNQQFWQNNDLQTEKTSSKNLSSTMKQVKLQRDFTDFFYVLRLLWHGLT